MTSSRVFSLSSLWGNGSHKKSKSATISTPFSYPPPVSTSTPQPSPSRSSNRPSKLSSPLHNATPSKMSSSTPPELAPIFTYLSAHSQKLYTEGYFLKLTDLNPDGKQHTDRQWVECFGQLVGTVLSLWDAAALDSAVDVEVMPTFLNLTDASIKMIENLPTRAADTPALKNVLSISTAGKNRYLFHFNSYHSLTQWTAGIKLALFEYSCLQEAYTGALIAGKGKSINGIQNIMERTRFQHEDWARIRFAAGQPWRKCWTVITPPDEKAYTKWKKDQKKGRPSNLVLGSIKFYETKKTKKVTPLATVTDVFATYAVYPQSEALIDHSTMVKVEGKIQSLGAPEPREGFVFIMPEIHPGVPGYEMMIRWLFPTFDTFHLYGRPKRLNADINDVRSLMFAMPSGQKYGYLDVADVALMIASSGKGFALESEWRKELKALTHKKMQSSRLAARNSFPIQPRTSAISFEDGGSSTCSSPVVHIPPQHVPMPTPQIHQRSMSEARGYLDFQTQPHGRTPHSTSPPRPTVTRGPSKLNEVQIPPVRNNSYFSGAELYTGASTDDLPADIPVTPSMAHPPSSRPAHPLPSTPGYSKRMSIATLDTIAKAATVSAMKSKQMDRPPSHEEEENELSHRPSKESNMFEGLEGVAAPISRGHTPRPLQNEQDESPTERLNNYSWGSHSQDRRQIASPLTATPDSEDSVGSLRNHVINMDALNKITHNLEVKNLGASRDASRSPPSRNSQSDYDDDEVDDYASSDEESPKRIPMRRDGPRTGVIKTVGGGSPRNGQFTPPKVDNSSNPDIPNFDFSKTISHGKSLSASQAAIDAARAATYKSQPEPKIAQTDRHSPESMARRLSQNVSETHLHGARSPTPSGTLRGNDTGSHSRYVHSRKSSGNILRSPTPGGTMPRSSSTDQLSRLPAMGNQAVFSPGGLISSPDLSSHLSAREQEYIARKTGTTLLQMDTVRSQPPHQAGLLGAIEAREKEKRDMRESWKQNQVASNNLTMQQALAQRQRHVRTSSSQGRGPSDSYGRATPQPMMMQYPIQSDYSPQPMQGFPTYQTQPFVPSPQQPYSPPPPQNYGYTAYGQNQGR